MTKPSETPRTDAAAFDQVCCGGEYPVKRKYYAEGDYVEADDARKLELELAEAKKAFPWCEEHKPSGGTRSGCPICAIEILNSTISRIDYACEQPNEMGVSQYDIDYNEDRVVKRVQDLMARAAQAECERDELLDELSLAATNLEAAAKSVEHPLTRSVYEFQVRHIRKLIKRVRP